MVFRIGQKIVCIDSEGNRKYVPPHLSHRTFGNDNMGGLKKGDIYTVESHIDYEGVPTITVEEIKRYHPSGGAAGFYVGRFRPVTNISIFEAMLKTEKTDA